MGFKLNRNRSGRIAESGNIKKKHKFKIVHKDLEEGVVGEAMHGGKIAIDKDVKKGSHLYKRAVAHESLHAKELAEGRIDYGEDYIRDGNKTYHRQTRNGKDMVKYNGKWVEVGTSSGPNALPWEKRAVKAEKNA